MSDTTPPPAVASASPAAADENQLIHERREKLKAIRQQHLDGKGVAFPNDFKPSDQADGDFKQERDYLVEHG